MLFLTYRHWTNSATGLALAKRFRKHNVPIGIWAVTDQRTQAADARFQYIEKSQAVIALLTPSAVYGWDDPYDAVRAELEFAVQAKIPIFTVIARGFTWDWAYEHDYLPVPLNALPDMPSMMLTDDMGAVMTGQNSWFTPFLGSDTQHELTNWVDEAVLPSSDQVSSEAYLEKAYILGHAKQYDAAIASYTDGIEKFPMPAHYVGCGQTYLSAGDQPTALKNFRQAIKLFPNDPIAYNFLGSLAEQSDNLQEAYKAFNAALQVMPDNEFALLRRAIVYRKLEQMDKALDDLNMLLTRFPIHADAQVEKGDIYVLLERRSEALTEFNNALDSDPRHVSALMSRGLVYLDLGDYTSALNDFDDILHIQPNYVKVYYNRGLSKQLLGDFVGATTDYTRAIQLNQNYAEAYLNRGIVQRAMGNTRQAIEDYTRAIKIDGGSPVAFFNRANALCDTGDNRKGIKDYDRALSLDPSYTKALRNRAFTYRDMKQYRKAIDDFEVYLKTLDDLNEQKTIQAVIDQLQQKKRRWF